MGLELSEQESVPQLLYVDPRRWSEQMEPALKRWLHQRARQLRCVSVRLAQWTVTVYCDEPEWLRLLSLDYRPFLPRRGPHVTLYVSATRCGELVEVLASHREVRADVPCGFVAPEAGCGWLDLVDSYRLLRQAAFEVLWARMALGSGRRSGEDSWLPLPAAAVEWPAARAQPRGVLLLGSPAARGLHAYLLGAYSEKAGFVSLDWCVLDCSAGEVLPGEGYFLVPGFWVSFLPRLLPYLALGELASMTARPWKQQLLAYQAPEDVQRAIEEEELTSTELVHIRQALSQPGCWVLVPADQLVPTAHLAEKCRWGAWVALVAPDKAAGADRFLVEPASGDSFLALLQQYLAAPREERVAERLLARLRQGLGANFRRGWRANAQAHPLLLQLALRHVLAGHSAAARWIQAGSHGLASTVLTSLRVQPSAVSSTGWSFPDERPAELMILESSQGEVVAALAVDASVEQQLALREPYGLIRAVWPGEIADFFSQYRHLGLRRLFSAWLPW
jgi:hypothetical protein